MILLWCLHRMGVVNRVFHHSVYLFFACHYFPRSLGINLVPGYTGQIILMFCPTPFSLPFHKERTTTPRMELRYSQPLPHIPHSWTSDRQMDHPRIPRLPPMLATGDVPGTPTARKYEGQHLRPLNFLILSNRHFSQLVAFTHLQTLYDRQKQPKSSPNRWRQARRNGFHPYRSSVPRLSRLR